MFHQLCHTWVGNTCKYCGIVYGKETIMSVNFWKSWISSQLKYNLDKMVDLSIKNFHFPGLNYVCFDFEPEKHATRLYIVKPEDNLYTGKVNIHNHLYDSQLLVLKGTLENRVYLLDYDSLNFYHAYHLTSALHPDNIDRTIKLTKLGDYGLFLVKNLRLEPGQFHFQAHTEIHSVQNNPRELSAWMVFEYATVKKHSTIFSKEELGDTLPTPNAYQKYEKEELRELVGSLLETL